MSENQSLPERADFRQLRTQAKELLEELRATRPTARLADAQHEIARRHGFASWPRLVQEVELPQLLNRMHALVERGDAEELDRLLGRRALLRKHIDDPVFGFDTPALVRAAHHGAAARLLPVLVKHGADPNARSRWWAGSFGALDGAKGETVDLLLSLGTKWDVWSAAGHGCADILKALLEEDPTRVNAPGGDGETPLHFAKTAEVAELLIARGADLEIRDVDHESTPLQYQVTNPEVARVLLRHGAQPDIFTAAALDDVEVLHRVLKEDPEAPLARVGEPPFVTRSSTGGHIYLYRLGTGRSPEVVAAERGSRRVLEALRGRNPAQDLIAAAWLGDEQAVHGMLHGKPSFEPGDHAALGQAAQSGRAGAVRLLLEIGLDPTAPGMDSGSALHVACWFGQLECVRLLIPHVSLELLDAHHGSPPLGWATHGAMWCRNAEGDYPGVVRALIEAGADPKAPANRNGATMEQQAGDREDVKAVLRDR